MGNNGKELYWILIKISQKGLKASKKQNICYFFFSVKDRNLFHLVNTIGNIFTRGFATRENITDDIHSMK